MSDQVEPMAGRSVPKAGDLPDGLGGLLPEFWSNALLGLCLTDAKGIIVAANAAFCAAVGRSADDLVGASSMGLIGAEAAVQGSLSHTAFINGDDKAMAGTVYLHKSGRPLFTHVTNTRLRSPDGRLFRLTSLVDLAVQVQDVGPLREHQRAENFSALAADISNDFNNLLSIILGYTAFLQDSARDKARLKTAIDGIESAVHRAANLIRQTLHLSRRDELTFQRTDLGHFAREFYRMTKETLTPGIEFSMNIEDGIPGVSLDPQNFHHALTNLGQKARDMVGRGGRLRVDVRKVSGGTLREKFPEAPEEVYVMLSLRAEPDADKLAGQENTGLWEEAVWFAERRRDLSVLVVHGIMAGHRGHLEVDGRSGAALVFSLYLPAAPEPAPEPPPPEPVAETATGEITMLLVDDEAPLLHTLKATLKNNGFRVIEARDGLEALTLFDANAADISIVLIDLGLPRMSGWEVFQKIKERAPGMRIVVMSGHLEANLKTKIIKGGASGFLQKPFALTAAVAEVKRVCGQPA